MNEKIIETSRYQAEFERLVTTISTRFINIQPDEIDREIEATLKQVGKFAGVDRSYMFLYEQDTRMLRYTHEWCAEGIEPQNNSLQALPVSNLPWQMEQMLMSGTVHIPRVADLPDRAASERKIFESQRIQSLITVPMMSRGQFKGMLGFDSVRRPQAFSENTISLLTIVGEIFVNALERKRVEEALAESEKHFRDVVEHSLTGISVLQNNRIVYFNPEMRHLLGAIETGVDIWSINEVDPEDENKIRNLFDDITEGRVPAGDVDFRFYPPGRSGSRSDLRWVSCRAAKIQYKGDDAILVNVMDITRARELERMVAMQDKMASLGRMTAGVAHEIRNPLNTICTSAETLLNKRLSLEDRRELQQYILEEARRLDRILEDFLLLSQIPRARIVSVDIGKLIDRVTFVLRNKFSDHVIIRTEMHRGEKTAFSDGDLLYQLLLNLGINAVEAIRERSRTQVPFTMDSGEITFTVSGSSSRLVFTVRDNGIGIPGGSQETIFDPFYTTKKSGTGLGLYIVHNIIETLDGEIRIESIKDPTVISVSVPLVRENCEEES